MSRWYAVEIALAAIAGVCFAVWGLLRPRAARRQFIKGMGEPDPTLHRTAPYPKIGHFSNRS